MNEIMRGMSEKLYNWTCIIKIATLKLYSIAFISIYINSLKKDYNLFKELKTHACFMFYWIILVSILLQVLLFIL